MTRQIPFLHWQKLSNGTEVGHWKPSPTLRKAGFVNQKLGTRPHPRAMAETQAIINLAMDLNEKVQAWRVGKAERHAQARAPRRWRFDDLVDAYKQADEYTGLKDKTQREYNVRLGQLIFWADEGRLPVRSIDKQMVTDLKKALMQASTFKCAATLRVLRLLLNWAKGEGIITANATDEVKIPSTPKRKIMLLESEVETAEAAATANGHPSLALAFQVGLWSFQREADLLALTRFNWRTFENVAPADAAILANNRGDVKGFRLQQQKTGAWVDCPMPPWLHDRIDAAFDQAAKHNSQHLFYDDELPARAYPDYMFQRRARKALDAAQCQDKRFRDLRRSGMSMFRDLGVETAAIVTISGHAVIGKASVLDDYMPANTRAACAAVATALRTRHVRQEKREKI